MDPEDFSFILTGQEPAAAPAQEPAAAEGDLPPADPAAAAGAGEATEPPAESQGDEGDDIETLRRQLAERDTELATMRASQAAPAAAVAPPAQPAADPAAQPRQEPKFNYTQLPQPLVALLNSEDPEERVQGFGLAMSAVANHIWAQFEDAAQNQYLPQALEQFRAQAEAQNKVKEYNAEFYGANPTLNTDQGRQLAQAAFLQLHQEATASGKQLVWGADLQKAVADRVYQLAPALKPAPETQPKPRFKTGGGARPAKPGEGTKADEIAATISF